MDMQTRTGCEHSSFEELEVRPFVAEVGGEWNPRAHGNVELLEQCATCGARRRVNVNGRHVEAGPWSGSFRERRARVRAAEREVNKLQKDLLRLSAGRPAPTVVYRKDDGLAAKVIVDSDGWLRIQPADGSELSREAQIKAASAVPELIEYGVLLRKAVKAVSGARAELEQARADE